MSEKDCLPNEPPHDHDALEGCGPYPGRVSEEEILAAEAHQIYCKQYEKNHGKPYWTGGDYSKLNEETKEYDRALARHYIGKLRTARAEGVKEGMGQVVHLGKGTVREILDAGIRAYRQITPLDWVGPPLEHPAILWTIGVAYTEGVKEGMLGAAEIIMRRDGYYCACVPGKARVIREAANHAK